jgi:hypothetical protein
MIGMKKTFMVTLADRETGQDQRVFVRAENQDSIAAYLATKPAPVHGPGITLAHPHVISIREVALKRPAATVLSEFVPEGACA